MKEFILPYILAECLRIFGEKRNYPKRNVHDSLSYSKQNLCGMVFRLLSWEESHVLTGMSIIIFFTQKVWVILGLTQRTRNVGDKYLRTRGRGKAALSAQGAALNNIVSIYNGVLRHFNLGSVFRGGTPSFLPFLRPPFFRPHCFSFVLIFNLHLRFSIIHPFLFRHWQIAHFLSRARQDDSIMYSASKFIIFKWRLCCDRSPKQLTGTTKFREINTSTPPPASS